MNRYRGCKMRFLGCMMVLERRWLDVGLSVGFEYVNMFNDDEKRIFVYYDFCLR